MAKAQSRGLPEGFELDIPEPSKAVQLGDYMEEVVGTGARKAPPVAPPAPSVLSEPETHTQTEVRPTKPRPAKVTKKAKVPFRKQINATPQTLEMVDALVDKVCEESPQRDAKASEVFQALVMALYDAKELIDLRDVEPRGRWGTPPAQAFIVNLKGAFQAAIAEHHKRKKR
jgi:hypothetical protein